MLILCVDVDIGIIDVIKYILNEQRTYRYKCSTLSISGESIAFESNQKEEKGVKLLQFYKEETNHCPSGCGNELKERICLGILTANGIIDVEVAAAEMGIFAPKSVKDAAKAGEKGMTVLEEIADKYEKYISDVRYAPAVTEPEKIICVGLNYRKHAEETKSPIPQYPILFNKFASSLSAHNGETFLPRAYKEYDYEAELVIVIGSTAKGVTREEARNCIFGFTCGNDVSNRLLQKERGGQWMIGKAADGFAPVGPVVDTEADGDNLAIKGYLNGELRQESRTNDLIFDTASIVSYISETVTLRPGDLIFTGTPSGVVMGYPKDEQRWLRPGDVYEVEIEGIGRLKTRFV